MTPVFLDHNATTPLDARVLEAMAPWFGAPANPSSAHRFGRAAREAVERARAQVATLVNARPGEVVFTSGGTESNNLAIVGLTGARAARVVVSVTEHPAVIEPARRAGAREVPVDADGKVDAAAFAEALGNGAAIASVMWANNETGVIQDVAALARLSAEAGVPFHTDAVQAVGKIPVDFRASGARLLSLSAHKLYGPQGIGALVFDRTLTLEPPLLGGGQQGGVRGGTESVALIVGFGAAAELAQVSRDDRTRHALLLRERLEKGLAALGPVTVIAQTAARLPNTTLFSVAGVEGETLLVALDGAGFAVSSGSACASGRREPSHVLQAMGVGQGEGVIRVSTGQATKESDIDFFINALERLLSPGGGLVGGAVGGW
ncbi:MAG: cysteine desulfurase family protein [Gammaproteobacteria bacterium]